MATSTPTLDERLAVQLRTDHKVGDGDLVALPGTAPDGTPPAELNKTNDVVNAAVSRLAEHASALDEAQQDITAMDQRLAAIEVSASGSAISGTFGAAETDVPGASLVTRARTNVNLRAVGGGQGDAIELYVLAEADYLAHQAGLADYLDSISADLTLTITAHGFATGTLAQVASGAFVAAMRVGASVAAPIYLYETAA